MIISDNYGGDYKLLNYQTFTYRSDPGPKLLQPIDTFEDVQDDFEGIYVNTTTTTEGFEKKTVRKRKRKLSESGLAAAEKEQEMFDSNPARNRVGRFSTKNAVVLDDPSNSRAESDSQVGFKAPPGMTFQPLCSACDESTDSE